MLSKTPLAGVLRLSEELPREKTRSWITVWEEKIVETDDPRWIDSVREVHRTSDAETDAAYALANVAPTTMAGVVGLLQYAISFPPEEWPEGVESDDDTETRPWHYLSDRNADRRSARHGGAIMRGVFAASLPARALAVAPLFLRRNALRLLRPTVLQRTAPRRAQPAWSGRAKSRTRVRCTASGERKLVTQL